MQLLDREATLLGAGKCPLYNYVSGMNRASGKRVDDLFWGSGQPDGTGEYLCFAHGFFGHDCVDATARYPMCQKL